MVEFAAEVIEETSKDGDEENEDNDVVCMLVGCFVLVV